MLLAPLIIHLLSNFSFNIQMVKMVKTSLIVVQKNTKFIVTYMLAVHLVTETTVTLQLRPLSLEMGGCQ